MSQITDINDVPITYISMVLNEVVNGAIFVIKVPCVTGMFLASNVNASASVKARLNGTADPMVDIAVSPINLTPYNGLTKLFDMQVVTNDVAGLVRVALPVRVTFQP